MKRSMFLVIAGCILTLVSLYFIFFPEMMLSKSLIEVNNWNINFARTSGIFILCFAIMSLLCRNADDSVALSAALLAIALMLILTSGLDAYIKLSGTPLKNTGSIIVRGLLAIGYLYYWKQSAQKQNP